MSNQGPAQEPTMEEILASIRRIISEDNGAQEAPAEEYQPAAPAYHDDSEEDVVFEEEEVMELDEALPEESDDAPAYEPAAYEPEPAYQQPVAAAPVYEEPAYEPEPEPEPVPAYEPEPVYQAASAPEPHDAEAEYAEPDGEIAFEEPPMTANSQSPRLMSSDTEQAAASSFGMLANSMLSSSGSGRTLEEVVGEQIRPMLKQWLDEHLPEMVERLVREEIERVSRRGR